MAWHIRLDKMATQGKKSKISGRSGDQEEISMAFGRLCYTRKQT